MQKNTLGKDAKQQQQQNAHTSDTKQKSGSAMQVNDKTEFLREQIGETPFATVKDENGIRLALGPYVISSYDEFETHEEIEKYVESKDWSLLTRVISVTVLNTLKQNEKFLKTNLNGIEVNNG